MAITNKARAIKLQEMQSECDIWNAENPVGAPVMVKLDGSDEPVATVTHSAASVLSGHSAVIWLKGVSGCYHLDRVRAAATPQECLSASNDLKKTFIPGWTEDNDDIGGPS